MQPNDEMPSTNATPSTNDVPQQSISEDLTVQPVSSEEYIREERAEPFLNTQLVPVSPPTTTSINDPPAQKKHRVLFTVFILLSLAQIYWFGDLTKGSVALLDSTRLTIAVASTLFSILIFFRYVQFYKFNGFSLINLKSKFVAVLAVLPIVSNLLLIGLLIVMVKFGLTQFSFILLGGVVITTLLALPVLLMAAIGMGSVIKKKSGIRRLLGLWPTLLVFVAAIISVQIVGGPSNSQMGIIEKTRLDQVRTHLSLYLDDRYGTSFNVSDVKYMEDTPQVAGIKVITASVSPVNDPDFSYVAAVYLHTNAAQSTDETMKNLTYREDFIGEYWKSGFEKTICPTVESFEEKINILSCEVTTYSLGTNYDNVLSASRGNIKPFSKLDNKQKELLNFNVTVESSDDENVANVLLHVNVVDNLIRTVQTTRSTSMITYYANSSSVGDLRLGYIGNTSSTSSANNIPTINLMYTQDAKESKSTTGNNKLYYNSSTNKFDLKQPTKSY